MDYDESLDEINSWEDLDKVGNYYKKMLLPLHLVKNPDYEILNLC